MSNLATGIRMSHTKDPKETIMEAIGDVSGLEMFHNLILVGIYKRPEKTAGGIIMTPKTQAEDVYQGVVGLVLKVGPGAFVDDAVNKFHGLNVKAGDWIVYRTSDTHKIGVNGTVCRMLEDAHVKAKVSHPDMVF